ncbi:MAG: hypothetical protein J7L08_02190 [Candidatus Aenigmarchaeota archaeon]|nr:hypothetical protein [Candidatus Aenigmarchaeota archaeon]
MYPDEIVSYDQSGCNLGLVLFSLEILWLTHSSSPSKKKSRKNTAHSNHYTQEREFYLYSNM